MLQIATGRFYRTQHYYDTPHRGVFYSNYRMGADDVLDTLAGRLLPAGAGTAEGPGTLAYEISEKIEWDTPAAGVLISTGGRELVSEFAAVMSFVLDITCTPDGELARRLLSVDDTAPPSRRCPRLHLRRTFDPDVSARPDDTEAVLSFVSSLVRLPRKSYEAVMAAIMRHVTATHRVADDTTLAYMLLVSSIESLAQQFEGSIVSWPDFEECKRRPVDVALEGAAPEVAARVREAILRNEHVALARRFRDFAMDHLGPAYFREEAADTSGAPGRQDLPDALRNAYAVRSGYVHRLSEMPRILSGFPGYRETVEIDGRAFLSLQGLARLSRHVIHRFVARQPGLEREDFDWRSALPNMVRMPFAPECWLGDARGFGPRTAILWLNGFLSQVSAPLSGGPPKLTNLTSVLDVTEAILPGLAPSKERRGMLALHFMFNSVAPAEGRRPGYFELAHKYDADFQQPTLEELAVHLVLGSTFPWDVADTERLRTEYLRCRRHKQGLKLGANLEVLLTLRLAEDHRRVGEDHRARQLIGEAVESLPGNSALRNYEAGLPPGELHPIASLDILMGKRPTDAAARQIGERP